MRAITIAVVLLLAFLGAGCGGDDEASDTDFAAGDCSELVEAHTELSNAFAAAGGTDADLDEVQELFEEFAADAPAEIEDDLQVLADAYTEYVDVLADIELEPGETPDANDLAQIQEALASLDQAEVTEASANVSQWTTENC